MKEYFILDVKSTPDHKGKQCLVYSEEDNKVIVMNLDNIKKLKDSFSNIDVDKLEYKKTGKSISTTKTNRIALGIDRTKGIVKEVTGKIEKGKHLFYIRYIIIESYDNIESQSNLLNINSLDELKEDNFGDISTIIKRNGLYKRYDKAFKIGSVAELTKLRSNTTEEKEEAEDINIKQETIEEEQEVNLEPIEKEEISKVEEIKEEKETIEASNDDETTKENNIESKENEVTEQEKLAEALNKKLESSNEKIDMQSEKINEQKEENKEDIEDLIIRYIDAIDIMSNGDVITIPSEVLKYIKYVPIKHIENTMDMSRVNVISKIKLNADKTILASLSNMADESKYKMQLISEYTDEKDLQNSEKYYEEFKKFRRNIMTI